MDHETGGRSSKTNKQWTLITQLYDLVYADDICLLSQKLQHMQGRSNNRVLIAERVSLRISKMKTKVIQNNVKQNDKIKLNGEDLECVKSKSFTSIGNIIIAIGGTEKDVKGRRGKDRLALNVLRRIWNASSTYTKT